MIPAMITCEPENPQIVLSGGSRSPSSNAAHMTLMSRPGRTCHTANVVPEKRPLPPVRRPRPSGPRPSMRNPPMTAVGTNSARNGRDQRRINAAPANTSDRIANDRPTSSALGGMTVSVARRGLRSRFGGGDDGHVGRAVADAFDLVADPLGPVLDCSRRL